MNRLREIVMALGAGAAALFALPVASQDASDSPRERDTDGPYTAGPIRGQPLPSDDYIGQAPTARTTPETPTQTRSLADRLGPVEAAQWGEAQCSDALYFRPDEALLSGDLAALIAYIRNEPSQRFASLVDTPGNQTGYKINLDASERVLSPSIFTRNLTGPQSFGDGTARMIIKRDGYTISNSFDFGFTPVIVSIYYRGTRETIRALEFSAC